MLLLQFCSDMGGRLANGRVPGNSGSAATSYGVIPGRATAPSVVDYFIHPAGYLPQVRALHAVLNQGGQGAWNGDEISKLCFGGYTGCATTERYEISKK